MATTGITEQDVWDAADKVDGKGQNPTLQRVREELGRGSFSTISAYMDTWRKAKATEPSSAADPAPDEVRTHALEASEAIWRVAVDYASNRHETERQEWLEEIAQRDRVLAEVNEAGDAALSQVEAHQATIDEQQARIEALTLQVEDMDQRAREAEHQRNAQAERDAKEIGRLHDEANTARQELREAERDLAHATAERDSLRTSLAEQQQRAERAEREWRSTQEALQADLQSARSEAKSAAHEVERLRPLADKAGQLEQESIRLAERLAAAKAEAERARQDYDECRFSLTAALERAVKAEMALEVCEQDKQRAAASKTPEKRPRKAPPKTEE